MKQLLSVLIFLLGMIYAPFLPAQALSRSHSPATQRMPGELIVQLEPETDPLALENLSFRGQNLSYDHCLSGRMHLHLYRFAEATLPAAYVLETVKSWPQVQQAQFNRKVQSRGTLATFPSDPQFAQQWGLHNTGQNGGQPDADIDAPEAWDLTTGGLSSLGDSIVIAVIDEGTDLTHPDLILWKNHLEIPNNGLDDDQNGYVDDYDGWDAQNDNGIIIGTNHGTHVTGIAAARGNDSLGVAGVNWQTKVMPLIAASGTEADVAEAYGYVLEMRRRYDETNGAEGAYVVVTNSSFGINFGNPADYPIWCAMYDSLGSAGILNVVSTMNNGVNIDQTGDMPSACPSNWVISVTSSQRNDTRFGGAAYGPINVDLGAPGQDVFSTYNGGGYGNLSGTSMAAPHVSGTIGLLFSYACPTLLSLYQSDPAQTALLMKALILNGVDTLASFQGEVRSNGRLNAYQSLLLTDSLCAALDTSCLPVQGLGSRDILDTSVTVFWNAHSQDSSGYEVRYRLLGTASWVSVGSTDTFLVINGLKGCQQYEYQVRPACGDFLFAHSFQTEGCCQVPEGLTVIASTDSAILLSWQPVFGTDQYRMQYRIRGETSWNLLLITEDSVLVENLPSCTAYEFRVGSECDTLFNGYSEILTGNTGNCSCTGAAYCEVRGGDATFEWLNSVEIGDFFHASGSNNAYGYFPDLCFSLSADSTYAVRLVPGYASFNFEEAFRIWLDLNQDGDFSDAGELLFDPQVGADSALNGQITIPGQALPGLTRMRIGMQFAGFTGYTPPEACAVPEFGEFEDYCVQILDSLNACAIPCGLTLDWPLGDSSQQIMASWQAANADSVELRIRAYGTQDWLTFSSTDTSFTFIGLDSCTTYEVQLRSWCGLESSTFGPSDTLSTKGCQTDALDPDWQEKISVYPNPFEDKVVVSADLPLETIRLFDLQGRELFRWEGQNRREMVLELESLNQGLYLLRVQTRQGIWVGRLQK
jgi:serine protease